MIGQLLPPCSDIHMSGGLSRHGRRGGLSPRHKKSDICLVVNVTSDELTHIDTSVGVTPADWANVCTE